MPKKLLRQSEVYLVAKPDQHTVVVERANWPSFLISSAKIKNEAATGAEDAIHLSAKRKQPLHIQILIDIAIAFFPLERERRGCQNQINGVVFQALDDVGGIPKVSCSVVGRI